jgi:CheY-like chemotaxis protein
MCQQPDGIDAIEIMKCNALAPASTAIDVVFMDLSMQNEGIQSAESIRRMPELISRRPTILAVFADYTDATLVKAAESGIRDYLTKPFVMKDLARLIRTYCTT